LNLRIVLLKIDPDFQADAPGRSVAGISDIVGKK